MRPTYTPKSKWSIGMQYEIGLGDKGSLTPRIDASYQGDVYTNGFNAPTNLIDAYTLANARLTWRDGKGDWESSLEVTNITDKYYFAKNTPSVRSTLREEIANVLDRLKADEVMDAYTLDVKSGRSEGNKGLVRVKLEAENVGHIKQFIVDYYNGIIESAQVA